MEEGTLNAAHPAESDGSTCWKPVASGQLPAVCGARTGSHPRLHGGADTGTLVTRLVTAAHTRPHAACCVSLAKASIAHHTQHTLPPLQGHLQAALLRGRGPGRGLAAQAPHARSQDASRPPGTLNSLAVGPSPKARRPQSPGDESGFRVAAGDKQASDDVHLLVGGLEEAVEGGGAEVSRRAQPCPARR